MHVVIPRATTEGKTQMDTGLQGGREVKGNLNGIIFLFSI